MVSNVHCPKFFGFPKIKLDFKNIDCEFKSFCQYRGWIFDEYSNTPRYAPPRYAYPADTPLWIAAKNSRYANFSDLSTPSYAIFDFAKKNPDMLLLVLYLSLAMPLWVVSKKSRYADFSPY